MTKTVTRTNRHVKATLILAYQYLRDHMSKQSNTYIYRDDLYRHYKQNTSPSRMHPHTMNIKRKTKNKNMNTML